MTTGKKSFQIVSDLHLEQNFIRDPFSVIRPVSPILVLAGDVGSLRDMSQLAEFFTKLCDGFQDVIYVVGNHEYYQSSSAEQRPPARPGNRNIKSHQGSQGSQGRNVISMGDLRQRALSLGRKISNLHVLDRKTVKINNILFAGATFWSDIRDVSYYPDYIRKNLNIDKRTYMALHSRDVKWLLRIINAAAKNDDVRLAIITHYPPTKKTLRKLGTKNEEFYASNREDLLKKNVSVWVYGHTHHNKDFRVNDVRLVSNQLGKKYDNCVLDPMKVVEME